MKILALDLGKYKTVGCDYERESGKHRFRASFHHAGGVGAVGEGSKTRSRGDRSLQYRGLGL